MKFRMLVLEGDREAEKRAETEHPPAYTKSEYLRRKRRQGMMPLFNRSFFLCRMIAEELKGIEIDGSGKITICAHQVHTYPGEEKYVCSQYFHISIYYLEPEEIDALDRAIDEGTETIVMAGILRNSLLDIAQRSNCSEDVIERIEEAFETIGNNHFVRKERIKRLTKRSKSNGLTAHMYRIFSEETGEGWYVKIADRKGNVIRWEPVGANTRYIDRLGSGLYSKAEWRGDTFVISEKFGQDIFSISVQP